MGLLLFLNRQIDPRGPWSPVAGSCYFIFIEDSDSDSDFIYSATYHTITIFNYIKFQTNGRRRPH